LVIGIAVGELGSQNYVFFLELFDFPLQSLGFDLIELLLIGVGGTGGIDSIIIFEQAYGTGI